jgi:hypothetical protein
MFNIRMIDGSQYSVGSKLYGCLKEIENNTKKPAALILLQRWADAEAVAAAQKEEFELAMANQLAIESGLRNQLTSVSRDVPLR